MRKDPKYTRLAVLGVALILALHYPLLAFFSVDTRLLGIPTLFLYLFWLWVVVIVLLYFLTRSIRLSKPPHEDE